MAPRVDPQLIIRIVVLLLIHFKSVLLITPPPPPVQQRIINGSDQLERCEYSVDLIIQFDGYTTWGGGTLVSYNVVLTQAHLVVDSERIVVQFGSFRWEDDMQSVQVRNYMYHSYYQPSSYAYDLALLRLATSIDNVAPGLMKPMSMFPLTQPDFPAEGTEGRLVGFGAIGTEPFVFPNVLQSMTQTVISNEECRELLGSDVGQLVTKDHFCAIDKEGMQSACIFDRGNGFVVENEGVSYVAGVLSIITNMCRPQFPAVYMKVQGFYDWVWQYIDEWEEDGNKVEFG